MYSACLKFLAYYYHIQHLTLPRIKNQYEALLQQQSYRRQQSYFFEMQLVDDKKGSQTKLKSSKVTFKQSLMGACTNIMFKLGGFGGIKKAIMKSPESNFIILGELISNISDAKEKLQKIIWFTYRQKLKIAEDLNSDVGWGCLPRVGQMVLAQAIVTHFKSKGIKIDKSSYKKIIFPFIDDTYDSSGYSLSMILKYARLKFAINPGQWFNIGQLSEVLRKIQDEKPIKGTQDLKIVFFNQSVIFLNHIQQKANIVKCRCKNEAIFCQECNKKRQIKRKISDNFNNQKSQQLVLTIQQYDSGQNKVDQPQQIFQIPDTEHIQRKVAQLCKGWEIYDDQNQKQSNKQQNKQQRKTQKQGTDTSTQVKQSAQLQKHLLLIVSVRISEKVIDKFDFSAILSLLSMPTSLGIIGGVPSKALYIVGHEGNQLIYLDPHYVQQHLDNQNFEQHLNTFFCNEYRTLHMQSLDPSMAFCFYMKTIEDIQCLMIKINQLRQLYTKSGKFFFISVMDTDRFDDQGSQSPENQFRTSLEYNSLQFRDIGDSL